MPLSRRDFFPFSSHSISRLNLRISNLTLGLRLLREHLEQAIPLSVNF